MSFKRFLESFVGSGKQSPAYNPSMVTAYYELFKNPTPSEWKDIETSWGEAKAVILPNGDVYGLSNPDNDTDIFHEDILNFLWKEGIIKKPKIGSDIYLKTAKDFFPIAREGKSDPWTPAYGFIFNNKKEHKKLVDYTNEYMNKAKKKNSSMKFDPTIENMEY